MKEWLLWISKLKVPHSSWDYFTKEEDLLDDRGFPIYLLKPHGKELILRVGDIYQVKSWKSKKGEIVCLNLIPSNKPPIRGININQYWKNDGIDPLIGLKIKSLNVNCACGYVWLDWNYDLVIISFSTFLASFSHLRFFNLSMIKVHPKKKNQGLTMFSNLYLLRMETIKKMLNQSSESEVKRRKLILL